MTSNEIDDAKRQFGYIQGALYELEPFFERICTTLTDMEKRLARLEQQSQRRRQRKVHTFSDGSQSLLPTKMSTEQEQRRCACD